MKKTASLAAMFACATTLAVAPPAAAINLTAGTIEAAGTAATVDLWYFTILGGAPLLTGVQLSPLAPSGPPGVLTTEDMGLLLYREVGGSIGALLGTDGIAGAAPRSARIELLLDPGDYVAVVSASTLSPGEFGPFQDDPAVTLGMDYELVLDQAGGNSSDYTCSIEGTLAGGFVVTKFAVSPPSVADCVVPSSVPEPGSLALLLAGLAAGAGIAIRRPSGAAA
ncbi:MAG: PEP-CTERM sorting domain-containing protein [Alphaproteobacteria bacterium]|nr:PEP-CTERM sorting domain-containing protein [Alphaproteobacteria bacterium]